MVSRDARCAHSWRLVQSTCERQTGPKRPKATELLRPLEIFASQFPYCRFIRLAVCQGGGKRKHNFVLPNGVSRSILGDVTPEFSAAHSSAPSAALNMG